MIKRTRSVASLHLSAGILPAFLSVSFPAQMQGGPPVPKKLYVGNLAYSVTNEDLKDLFSQSGTVESVAVVSDKFSGQSKGFGFVEMADAGEAAAAIQSLDGTEFKGRNIKVNEAKPREAGSGGGPRGGGGGGRGGDRDRSGGGGRGNRW